MPERVLPPDVQKGIARSLRRSLDRFQIECLTGKTLVGLGRARNSLLLSIRCALDEQLVAEFGKTFADFTESDFGDGERKKINGPQKNSKANQNQAPRKQKAGKDQKSRNNQTNKEKSQIF